jgi:RNA polymerase primary sigma factor
VGGKLNKIGRAKRKLVTGLGREPTTEEISEVTGIEPEEIESIKRLAQTPISLEKPVGDEDQSEFGQFIADEQAESPYERALEILTNEALQDALENLGYRERRVLELRYGLGGEHPRTVEEVGRAFNVTRERIRQIEHHSLKKLQNLAEAQKLRNDHEIASGFAPRTLRHRT